MLIPDELRLEFIACDLYLSSHIYHIHTLSTTATHRSKAHFLSSQTQASSSPIFSISLVQRVFAKLGHS